MDRHQLFREITTSVCGTLDLAEGLKGAFAVLKQHLPLDELRLNVLDHSMHAIKSVATADDQGAQNRLDAPLVVPMTEEVERELRGRSLADVRIVGKVSEDRTSSHVTATHFADVPDSSLLLMRLLLDGERQGTLLLRAVGEDRYTDAHKEIVASLNEPFAIALNNALVHHELYRLRDYLHSTSGESVGHHRYGRGKVVGAQEGLASVMRLVESVATLQSPVLILGETGVGKEVVADAIHHSSSRQNGPFVKLNCGALPESLIDSELFGHAKGAFTGAVEQKKGRFELADGGTLFLDEVGELPPEVQVRLLRILQTGTFQRVGGSSDIKTDVRIIAATHRNLEQLVAEGRFREDLWYRINVFPIRIPPLRERKSDIPALVDSFLQKKAAEIGVYPPPPLGIGAMDRLQSHDWPGNVRELENAVEREIILSRGAPLTFELLGESSSSMQTTAAALEPVVPLNQAVEAHIRRGLSAAGGRVEGAGGAAELLKVNPSTLRHKMRKLGIPFGRPS